MGSTVNFINLNLKDVTSTFIDNSARCFTDFNTIHYKNVKASDINYLPIYLRVPHITDEILSKIHNDIFLLMQQGIIRPLIIMATEQWDLFDTFKWKHNKLNLVPDFGDVPYSQVVKHFTTRCIPEENITWLVPNTQHKKDVSYLKEKGYSIKTKFYTYDFFLEIMKPVARDYEIKAKNFKRHFSCLCRGTPRNHRYGIIYNIWKNQLFNKGAISCSSYQILEESKQSNWVNDTVPTETFMNNFEDWEKNKELFIGSLPIHYDNLLNEHWGVEYNEESIFDDNFLWVASETKKTHDGVYITEKTWKAIAYGSPFVINGDNRSLQYLKDMGFKTFDQYWDESYDEVDDIKKIKIIVEIIKNLCEKSLNEINDLYKDMIPILQHNQKILINNTQHTDLINSLSEAHGKKI